MLYMVFIEIPTFTRMITEIMNDEEYQGLQNIRHSSESRNPEKNTVKTNYFILGNYCQKTPNAVALERANILLDEMLCMKYYAYTM